MTKASACGSNVLMVKLEYEDLSFYRGNNINAPKAILDLRVKILLKVMNKEKQYETLRIMSQ